MKTRRQILTEAGWWENISTKVDVAETLIIGRLEELIQLFENINRPEIMDKNMMQARADYHRDHADQMFPELHYHGIKGWVNQDDKEVVFTPYGYRLLEEVRPLL